MMLRPLRDRILIRPDPVPTETASGLQIVEHWKPEQMGTVIAIGAQARGLVQPGQCVIFGWNVGQEIFVDGDRLFLMREADLSAVVEDIDVGQVAHARRA